MYYADELLWKFHFVQKPEQCDIEIKTLDLKKESSAPGICSSPTLLAELPWLP